MREIHITLPHPPSELSPNARVCWPVRAKAAKLARSNAKAAMKNALAERGVASGDFKPTCYELEWLYKGRKPDADNVLASCKAYLDGIAEALGIDDRDLECDGISRTHFKDFQDDAEVGLLVPMVHFVLYEDGSLGGSISDTICEM